MTCDASSSFDVLQFMDSAFPIGGFAHSCGLESVCSFLDTGFGTARDKSIKGNDSFSKFETLLTCVLENAGSLQIPFVRDAASTQQNLEQLCKLDRTMHILMSNHVAKRASLQQGKSLAAALKSTFVKHPQWNQFDRLYSAIENCQMAGHFAVVFGIACSILQLDVTTAAGFFLFGVLRTVIGSAVRMGLFGPLKAQEIQNRLQYELSQLVNRSLAVTEPHICHPVLEIAQNAHEKLFAKLFYS